MEQLHTKATCHARTSAVCSTAKQSCYTRCSILHQLHQLQQKSTHLILAFAIILSCHRQADTTAPIGNGSKRYIEKRKCVEMKYTSLNCNSVMLHQTHRDSERGTEESHGASYPGSWQSCIHMSHPHCIATYPYIQLPHQTKNILFSNTTQLLSSL